MKDENYSEEPVTEGPEARPTIENKETRHQEVLGFSWLTRRNELTHSEGIGLSPDPEKAYAFIVYGEPLPPLPEEITSQLSEFETAEGKKVYYAGFGKFDLSRAANLEKSPKTSLTHHKQALRKGDEVPHPQEISTEEAAEIIATKKTLIYTGAGISVAAGAPDMKSLMEGLGIDRSQGTDTFTHDIFFDQEDLKRRIESIQAGFFERTTKAHLALAELQQKQGFRIATENLDYLHEAVGTEPIKRGQIEKEISDDDLKVLDYIVTVGLRADDSGLLFRFRQVNPGGKILAINLEAPPYMDDTNLLLKGDCQTTVPAILEVLK